MTAAWVVLRSRFSGTFIRYFAVGLSSLGVDAGTLWLLYDVADQPLWLATTAGFWLAFAANFLANKYFTFEIRTGAGSQLRRYGILVVLNYLANLAIVTGLVALSVPAVVAKVIAVGLLWVVNFLAYKHWVFRG
ncbi:GtrA family protein [Blastococcus capsensis]|uniref:GtrA family protein n=1 Tax=Blastococcus capsensis TaxID=1564163 RepID=UPI00253FB60A|nr:GtrA family protein [Blastococcus capsensis]MDK3256154.1 GtrA family protein [Blastococcus capsensis]